MKRENKYRIITAILAVLLLLSVCALVLVLIGKSDGHGSDTAPGNKIVSSAAVINPFHNGRALQLNLPTFRLDLPKTDEKIKLTEKGKETVQPFSVNNMLPGDTAEKVFSVTVADKSAKTLSFSASLTSGTVPGDKLTLTVKAGQTVLYSGALGDVGNKDYSVNAPCDVDYTITVSLDKSAGNEYAGLSIGMKFAWSFSYEEYDPITVTYTDGVLGSAFADQSTVTKSGEATPAFDGTPTREGYVFQGWYPEVAEKVTANVTYTAQWAVEVLFIANGETVRVTVPEGYTAEKPTAPEKSGYGFAGWYLDNACTQKFDFQSPLTEGVSLYARFFLFGDVDGNGLVTAADADLIGLYVMEIDNDNIHNIMAGRVSALSGSVTANDANNIVRYVMEAIDSFPVEIPSKGCEYDIENQRIIYSQE